MDDRYYSIPSRAFPKLNKLGKCYTFEQIAELKEAAKEFERVLKSGDVTSYAEADVKTRSTFREWRHVYKIDGRSVKNGKAVCTIKPFAGAKAVFVYAYAKYINGFRVMSKIAAKRLSKPNSNTIKSRMLFSGKEMDSFGVAKHWEYSIGGIFLEKEAIPKISVGYGGIRGAYSMSGIRTYKISSPRYIPDENALLEFDAYSAETQCLEVAIEVADAEKAKERFTCIVEIKGGGKWKRNILTAADFKGEVSGMPLQNFFDGSPAAESHLPHPGEPVRYPCPHRPVPRSHAAHR